MCVNKDKQLMWERNVAISQLESIGAQFGQKMDEFKKEGELP